MQFQAIGPTQRDAILRALREDVEKLIQDYGPYSRETGDLQAALIQCEEIYRILSAQLEEKGQFTIPTCIVIVSLQAYEVP